MPKDLREKVTLSPEAYKALQIEAMLRGGSMKETASKLILKAACPKCKEIMDIMGREPNGDKAQVDTPAKEPKGKEAKEPKGPLPPMSPKAKGKKLSQDTMALDQIKILWARSPRPSQNSIAREIGYPETTTKREIKRMKDRGEL